MGNIVHAHYIYCSVMYKRKGNVDTIHLITIRCTDQSSSRWLLPIQNHVLPAEKSTKTDLTFHVTGNIVERKQTLFHVYTVSQHLTGKTIC